MNNKRIFAIALSLSILSLPGLSQSIAFAESSPPQKDGKVDEGKELFKKAKDCYDGRQYKQAAELFWQSIVKGNGAPGVWLYCGHAYSACGNYTKARKIYSDLINNNKGSREAKAARTYIARIANKPDKLVNDPKTKIKTLPPPKPNTDLAKAVALFKAKKYDEAKAQLRAQLAKTPNDARCYYYMALTNHYQGKTSAAVLNYRKVAETAPSSNLSVKALSVLAKLDPTYKPGIKRAGVKRLRRGSVQSGLINRIKVIPPHKNYPHSRVRKQSIETIKDVCRKIPKAVSKKLCDGNCTINIAPNMLDKWPNGYNDKSNQKPELYCFEEPSRTYGVDAYIYEASNYRSSKNMMPPYSQAQIRQATMHELANVLMFLDGNFIENDKNIENVYKKELKSISGNAKKQLGDHAIPARDGLRSTCADIVAGLMGSRDRISVLVLRSFPKTTKWLKIRLGL